MAVVLSFLMLTFSQVANAGCQNTNTIFSLFYRRTGRAGNKGVAYTFITPEQKRQAGDIIKAFEATDTPVPPELQAVWETYVEEMKAVGLVISYISLAVSGTKNFAARRNGLICELYRECSFRVRLPI